MAWLLSLLVPLFPSSRVGGDFGVREFQSKEQMQTFLRDLGFSIGNKLGDYDLWETKTKPQLRAISYKLQNAGYLAKQLILQNHR